MTKKAPSSPTEIDEALAAEARGVGPTSDDADAVEDDALGEVDAIGAAAGLHKSRDSELNATDEIAQRDAHRWELDPASAEDAKERMP
ncbi:hypothetical protein BH11MYX2_BH11MYX2_10320 [soil metagenome]